MLEERYRQYLANAGVEKKFEWIKKMRKIRNFYPSAGETYKISMKVQGYAMPKEWYETGQREKLESFIRSYYDPFAYQVLFCWQETGVIVIAIEK